MRNWLGILPKVSCSSGRTRFFLVCLLLWWLVRSLLAQTPEAVKPRPPVTPEDLAMTDLPELPGAPAVCLYYERIDNRLKSEQSVFKRIKILTPAGRDYANLEIPYYAFLDDVTDIKVKVYSPDGSSREVKPEILEKIASKLGESEYRIKTLAVPDISPGQIIDYEYKIKPRENSPFVFVFGGMIMIRMNIHLINLTMPDLYSSLGVSWELQDSIYIRKARFKFVPDAFISVAKKDKYNLAWVANKLREVKPAINEKGLELELTDIPPFDKEEFMPPESSQKISFQVYYVDPSIQDNKTYWEKSTEAWKKDYEEFMKGEKDLNKEIKNLVGSETDEETKLKKIYERVQKIKNLDFVTEMPEKERQKLKENNKVTEVLKRNYGYKNQIARTFAALVRAAGYESYLVRVVSRDKKLFNSYLPLFYTQFDSEMVIVKVGNRFKAFDPGLPDCPYGVVFWPKTNTAAVTFEHGRASFFTTASLSASDATRQRLARLRLDEQGNLSGTIRVEYTGQEALSRKLENKEKDEVKIKEILEEELLNKLPPGSKVSLIKLEGMNEKSTELTAEFEATLPGVAFQSGGQVLLPVYALTNARQYPFRSAIRKYPVYFNYPYTEIDEIKIKIPEGYEIEALPADKSRDSERAGFSLTARADESGHLVIERKLAIKKNIFPESEYIHLKEFFDFVQSRDEQQIILRKKN